MVLPPRILTTIARDLFVKIIRPILADFDIGDRNAIRAAFADAPTLQMQEAWRDAPAEKFLPARVSMDWRTDRLLVFSEVTDAQLFTQETED